MNLTNNDIISNFTIDSTYGLMNLTNNNTISNFTDNEGTIMNLISNTSI